MATRLAGPDQRCYIYPLVLASCFGLWLVIDPACSRLIRCAQLTCSRPRPRPCSACFQLAKNPFHKEQRHREKTLCPVISMHKKGWTEGRNTYSTCFDHSGGSLKVMNIQLVKIVHIMIMLKRVRELRRIGPWGTNTERKWKNKCMSGGWM